MPNDLIASDIRQLFPQNSPSKTVYAFCSDFDRVPDNAKPSHDGAKFAYGHPAEWEDLSANWDIGRGLTSRVRALAKAMLDGTVPERFLIVIEGVGTGKTTTLRRTAYELSRGGVNTLYCSTLSRLDAQLTAEAIDLIDAPLAIIIDNFAEHAGAIANIYDSIEKKDVIFVCSERSYRKKHIARTLGATPYRTIDGLELSRTEATQLVRSYASRGLTSSAEASKRPEKYADRLVGEPIAVACCHILNDVRPLDKIVSSTYSAASSIERKRYLLSALSSICFSGGIRYEILASATNYASPNEQFNATHQLPLTYSDGSRKNFVIPLNSTLAERTLAIAPKDDVAACFKSLANSISSRVNRNAIVARSPEARLAGRLFDYEDVTRRYLGDSAGEFYVETQNSWKWNSRYWEQLSLYFLSRYRKEKDYFLLQQAIQHAKHAISIEFHPFPLTTLGKVLLAQLGTSGISNTSAYSEAHENLTRAIEIERSRGRVSMHAYITLFYGALQYMDLEGNLTDKQIVELKDLIKLSRANFARDLEIKDISKRLEDKLRF